MPRDCHVAAYCYIADPLCRICCICRIILTLSRLCIVGNPWLDPFYQYDASEFAHGLGLISLGQRHKLKEMELKCQALLKGGTPPHCAGFSVTGLQCAAAAQRRVLEAFAVCCLFGILVVAKVA
jgi:hypothetical protein